MSRQTVTGWRTVDHATRVQIAQVPVGLTGDQGSGRKTETPDLMAQRTNGRRAGEGSRTILLVDDDASLRKLLRTILAARGYEVVEAASAAEALTLSAQHEVDLLLTDMRMPGMSGRELAAAVTANKPAIAVLFVSGLIDEDTDRAHGHGRQAYLQKPATPDALLASVERLLRA